MNKYASYLWAESSLIDTKDDFLIHEIDVLMESKGICFSNYISRAAFTTLLRIKINSISSVPVEFLNKLWSYVESVFVHILSEQSDCYPQLQNSIRRASESLISKKKNQSIKSLMEIMEMERLIYYTYHPEYISTLNNLMKKQDEFMGIATGIRSPPRIMIDGFGQFEVGHLRSTDYEILRQAFDLKMRMFAYWQIVLRRLVDSMALHINCSIHNLINSEMEAELTKHLFETNGLKRMLEESPGVTDKRSRLNQSINLLKESKDIVAKIMNEV